MADINKRIQRILDDNLAWSAIAPSYNFTIEDIWGVEEFLTGQQNHYFFGSKGSGKSSLVTIAKGKISELPYSISCVIHSSIFENDVNAETHVGRVLKGIFDNIIETIESKQKYQRWKWLSSTYVGVRNFFDLRHARKLSEDLVASDKGKNSGKTSSLLSQTRLELSAGIGEVELSAFSAGTLKLGNASITPLQLGFKISPDKDLVNRQSPIDDLEINTEQLLSDLSKEVCVRLKEVGVRNLFILIDDYHLFSIVSQVQILKTLARLKAKFKENGVSVSYKIFSATDLSVDILNSISLSTVNEITYLNIEASLDKAKRTIKRRAMENRLVKLLSLNKISPDVIDEKFPPDIMNHVFTLSGGHFRRAWKIFSKMLDSEDKYAPYDVVEKASADVIKEFRDNLPAQVGIEKESYRINYKNWYNTTITNMVRFFQRRESALFVISESDQKKYPELVQWVNDAIAIGDVLEIAKDFFRRDDKDRLIHYWLLALNPATVRGILGYSESRITYQSIEDIQSGLKNVSFSRTDAQKLSSKT